MLKKVTTVMLARSRTNIMAPDELSSEVAKSVRIARVVLVDARSIARGECCAIMKAPNRADGAVAVHALDQKASAEANVNNILALERRISDMRGELESSLAEPEMPTGNCSVCFESPRNRVSCSRCSAQICGVCFSSMTHVAKSTNVDDDTVVKCPHCREPMCPLKTSIGRGFYVTEGRFESPEAAVGWAMRRFGSTKVRVTLISSMANPGPFLCLEDMTVNVVSFHALASGSNATFRSAPTNASMASKHSASLLTTRLLSEPGAILMVGNPSEVDEDGFVEFNDLRSGRAFVVDASGALRYAPDAFARGCAVVDALTNTNGLLSFELPWASICKVRWN